jgi:hypothetical protein
VFDREAGLIWPEGRRVELSLVVSRQLLCKAGIYSVARLQTGLQVRDPVHFSLQTLWDGIACSIRTVEATTWLSLKHSSDSTESLTGTCKGLNC